MWSHNAVPLGEDRHESRSRFAIVHSEASADARNQAVPACVSLYGHDPMLLSTRAHVIETGGFRTCTVRNHRELVTQLEKARCGVVVLCYTLHEDEALQASTLAKNIQPTAKVVAMESFWSATTLDSTDAVVSQFGCPQELIAVLKRLVPSASYQL